MIAYPISYPIRYLTPTRSGTRIVIAPDIGYDIVSPVPVPVPDKGYDSLLIYRLALANARARAGGR